MTQKVPAPAPDQDPQKSARVSIRLGIEALQSVESALDNSLGKSLDELSQKIINLSGRVIVTGLGKSGHIAKKIASTFASTGTPAFFVHAAEANHGDLGMITENDLVLAFSWSGETRELDGIITYCNRFGVPLAAITTNPKSALATNATYALTLPTVTEACPNGLAPTTSSLVQLAIGDALAMTLLSARGFSSEQFSNFHPGGKIGARLTKANALMHEGDKIPLINATATMPDVLAEMSTKGFGCVGILDDEAQLIGIITDGDLRRNLDRSILSLTARDIMTSDPKTYPPENLAVQALAYCQQNSIQALFIVEQGKPVGLLHIYDLLQAGIA